MTHRKAPAIAPANFAGRRMFNDAPWCRQFGQPAEVLTREAAMQADLAPDGAS